MAGRHVRQDIKTAIDRALQTATGKSFEKLAQEVLRHKHPRLQPIVPHGRDGDGGNDAYIRTKGSYFQIHGTAASTLPGSNAARKVKEDVAKVVKTWTSISPLKSFTYVANALGSNVHLERAFQELREKYGIEVGLVDSAILCDWMLTMPPEDLERLTGFTIEDSHPATGGSMPLDDQSLLALSTGDLEGLHLLAAIVHPLPPKLYEELLREVTNWRRLIQFAIGRGWVRREQGFLFLDDGVARQLRRNSAEQGKASERWAEVLASHGTVDCLYLSALPLVTLGRLSDAARTLTEAGLACGDDGWARPILHLVNTLHQPKLLKRLDGRDRRAFCLARARLCLLEGDAAAALAVYEKELAGMSPLPNGVSRGRMMIDHGVSAYEAGDAPRGREVFDKALQWGRRHGDDWVIGRAATNVAQFSAADDGDEAERLLDEAAAAKARCGDDLGRIGVSMARGNIAAAKGNSEVARGHFQVALALADEHGAAADRANILFNIAKTAEDAGNPGRAAVDYRRSFVEATKRGDVQGAARAMNGLAASSYARGRWDKCREACEYLRELPTDLESLADFRLTGLHGLIVLTVRENVGGGSSVGKEVGVALRYARKFGCQDWVVRLVLDPAAIRTSGEFARADLKRILGIAQVEFDGGRLKSCGLLADVVWQRCLHTGGERALAEGAEAVLKAAIDGGFDAVDVLTNQYALLLELGEVWLAVDALSTAAQVAKAKERWEDYTALTDQQGVILQGLDRGESAAALHREAYRVAKKHSIEGQVARCASNLAECCRQLGQLRLARRYSQAALDRLNPSNDAADFVFALHNHYLVERDLEDPTADATLRRCERLAWKHDLPSEIMRATMARGNRAWDRGHLVRARNYFRKARGIGTTGEHDAATSTCRYNEALVLRELGKVEEALSMVRDGIDLPVADPLHVDMLRLAALLSEEAGESVAAEELWSRAARAARFVRRAGEAAYFAARAQLLKKHAEVPIAERVSVADNANELLLKVQNVPDRGTACQDAYDRATAYYTRHGLAEYKVVLNRVLADRLSFGGGTPDDFAAAKASTASLLAGAADAELLEYAAELHVGWLIATALSARQLRRLRGRVAKWLSAEASGKVGRYEIEGFLFGFDAVADEIEARHTPRQTNR